MADQAKKTVGQYVEYIGGYVEAALEEMNNQRKMQQEQQQLVAAAGANGGGGGCSGSGSGSGARQAGYIWGAAAAVLGCCKLRLEPGNSAGSGVRGTAGNVQ